ncbi:MAG: tRNA (adenosine(37)-N6)-threonylcarbamoyltransferase complex ATPase subunit type 1 TsaE [Azospirillaceae bacterium]
MSRVLEGEAATIALAQALAPALAPGAVITLAGDLGTGKTVFARALIRHAAGAPDLEVPSPTFTLVQVYDTPDMVIWHFDLYRLSDPEEVVELDWDEALAGVVLVEWPDRLGDRLPADRLAVTLGHDAGGPEADPEHRRITLEATGPTSRRLLAAIA